MLRSLRAIAPTIVLLGLAGCGGEGSEQTGPDPVPDLDPAPGVELVIEGEGPFAPGDIVDVHVENNSNSRISYGACPELQRLQDGAWVPARDDPGVCIAIAYVQAPGVPGQDLSAAIPDDAGPGDYRLVHEVKMGRRNVEITAELEVAAP